MLIFLDSADLYEIQSLCQTGMVDGVTTNPSLCSKSVETGTDFFMWVKTLCTTVQGPVSIEVLAKDAAEMVKQGKELAKLSEHVVIKLPVTQEGMVACHQLTQEGISVNMTLCFSLPQAVLAAKAGARFISPFVGRLNDHGACGITFLQEIAHVYAQYDYETLILAASLRDMNHVIDAIKAGVDALTLPISLFKKLCHHPLTTTGLEIFQKDWEKRSF